MLNQAMKKITPKFLRQFLKRELKKSMSRTKSEYKPDIMINNDHIQSAKLLVDRDQLLRVLPKKGIVAEIGVAEGNFSQQILEIASPAQLHLIDAWHSERYDSTMHKLVKSRFEEEIKSGSVSIHRGMSTIVGQQFPDRFFDWVYIDTDHSYNTTREELEIYRKKVKKHGVIAGHDFTKGNFDDWIPYGVVEAVFEFCTKYDWKLIYMTMELTGYPSFAIQCQER